MQQNLIKIKCPECGHDQALADIKIGSWIEGKYVEYIICKCLNPKNLNNKNKRTHQFEIPVVGNRQICNKAFPKPK